MYRIRAWLSNYWEILFQIAVGLAIIFVVLFYKLGSITSGASPSEVKLHNQIIAHLYSVSYLWHNIVGLPYYGVISLLTYTHHSDLAAIRGVGAAFGVLTVLAFYYTVRRWHGSLVALLASAVFSINIWFLLSTRLGKSSSIYGLASLTILIIGFLNRRLQQRSLNLLIVTILVSILFYVPGLIWLIIIGLIWQWPYLSKEYGQLTHKLKLAYPVLLLVLLSPLISSLYLKPSLIRQFVGLPTKFASLQHILFDFAKLPYHLFLRGNPLGNLGVGHLPIINVFASVMIVIGLYDYVYNKKYDRLRLILGVILIGLVLTALGGQVPLYLTMPFWFILVAAGMSYLINQWFSVFPKNPVARSVGMILLILAVGTVIFYQYNQFFVAWPHTTEAIHLYSQPI